MKLREALITQAPSLALQRAAADEIARLDAALKERVTISDVAQACVYAEVPDSQFESISISLLESQKARR